MSLITPFSILEQNRNVLNNCVAIFEQFGNLLLWIARGKRYGVFVLHDLRREWKTIQGNAPRILGLKKGEEVVVEIAY